jgi:hypothetical protein
MLLAVAVVFIGFQVAQPMLPALVAPSVASASESAETTDTKLAAPMMNTSISCSKNSEAPEESNSASSGTARLKMDSIYATDKGRQPGVTTTFVAQNSQSFSTIRISDGNVPRREGRGSDDAAVRAFASDLCGDTSGAGFARCACAPHAAQPIQFRAAHVVGAAIGKHGRLDFFGSSQFERGGASVSTRNVNSKEIFLWRGR